jgi:hypothetical protein
LEDGNLDLDLSASNSGVRFSAPKQAFFVQFNGSVMPILKAGQVQKDYEETVHEKSKIGAEYLTQQLTAAMSQAKAGVAEALAKAGVPTTSPMYKPLFEKYLKPYAEKIAATGAEKKTEGSAKVAHAMEQGQYRTDELILQDSFQEIVVGYDDGTYFFRVGKFKANSDIDSKSGISEMGKYVATKPVTDELKTSGQARSNVELGRRDIDLSKVKVTLVAFAGKEGRVFLSAIQDTTNALHMTDEDFENDSKLIGFNNAGGSVKFDFNNTNNSLTVIGMGGPKGASVGTELRLEVLPELIAHVAYMYANKFGAKGNQVRGQLDYHIGEKFGANWTVALYAEHSTVQRYEQLPITVESETGFVTRTDFGAALSASKKDSLIKGVEAGAILDLGYQGDGTVNDAHNFPSGKAVSGDDLIDGGFVGTLNFQLRY